MSFTIKHGLFKLNIIDSHAILGVSVNEDPKKIRLQYLKIARKIHPDTFRGDREKKKLANKILSQLVNPAYETLSKKNLTEEHLLVLTQMGKSLAEKKDKVTVGSESAKELLKAGDKIESVYTKNLQKLASEQYNSLDKIIDNIALISELNLTYLMLRQEAGLNREEKVIKKIARSKSSTTNTEKSSPTSTTKNKTTSHNKSIVNSCIQRAKEYIASKNTSKAIAELREAIKLEPENSTSHGLLGQIYLHENQLTMAKIHITKAEKANPHDPIVIKAKKQLDKLSQKKTSPNKSQKKTTPNKSQKKTSQSKSKSNGLFGGLFGAKKK